jgi:predicted lipoprotein with Yx(FWY)xxD motif
MRKSLMMFLTPMALLAAACGSSHSSSKTTSAAAPATTSSTAASSTSATSAVQIATRSIPGLGVVLVNGKGRTLYVFAPDKAKTVTCVGGCASVWPPLAISTGQKPTTSGQVKATLVSSDPNPAGGRVVTYGGWPLYSYVADASAGTASGQALNSSGGLWYVISPTGKVITQKASAGSGTSSTTNAY